MTSVSVLITTKDRAEMLDRALRSVYSQSVVPDVIVVDDGSSDETSELVRARYPNAVLVRNEAPSGIIAVRNQGFGHAVSDYVLTLDDDAELVNENTIAAVPGLFESPEIGVVALPIVDFVDGSPHARPHPQAADDGVVCMATFSGGACVIRRSDFVDKGGYSGLGRQGEEADYSLRLLDDGIVVRAAPTDLRIHHFPNHSSSDLATHLESAAQNRLLSAWQRSPNRFVAFETIAIAANYTRLGFRSGHLRSIGRGLARAWPTFRSAGVPREPVQPSAFRLHRRLKKSGGLPLTGVRRGLPRHQQVQR